MKLNGLLTLPLKCGNKCLYDIKTDYSIIEKTPSDDGVFYAVF